MEITEALKI